MVCVPCDTPHRAARRRNHGPLLALQPFTRSEIVGFAVGSVSSVLYLCSRLPQIYTNVSAGRGAGQRPLPGPRCRPETSDCRGAAGSSFSPLLRGPRPPSLIHFSVFLLRNLMCFSPLPVFRGWGFRFASLCEQKGNKKALAIESPPFASLFCRWEGD